nr:lysylphosphatidylglycerol synthase domain-containing protein [Enterovirga sp. DB1703]
MLNRRTQLSLALVAGLTLAVGIAAHAGMDAVAEVLSRLGGTELLWLCAMQVGSVLLCGLAWWVFTIGASLVACTAARFVRDGASSVLAIIPGMGEVAGIRALTLFGARAGNAAGSGVIDLATEIVAQILFTLAGVVALVGVLGWAELDHAIGIAVASVLPLVVAYLVFRIGRIRKAVVRFVARVEHHFGLAEWGLGAEAGRTVAALWQDRPRLLAGILIHFAAWMLSALQIWYAAWALEAPLSPLGSLALAALVHAARGVLFVVPWGAGVQEVGFVVAGVALGLDEPTGIAMSLAFRVRDILLALPALLLWGVAELRELWLAPKFDAQAAKAKSRPGAASSSARV